MSKLYSALFLFVALCLSGDASITMAQIGEKSRTPPSKLPPAAATKKGDVSPPGWRLYQFAASGFSAVFPREPQEQTERLDMGGSTPSTAQMYVASTDGGVFMVAYFSNLPLEAEQMTERARESFYEGMWRGMVNGMRQGMERNGMSFEIKPLGGRRVVLGGSEGREQDFMLGPLEGKAQMTITGRRAYVVLTMLKIEAPADERAHFFDSFEIHSKR